VKIGRWFILVLGAAALVGAVISLPSSTPPTHHFAPSAAQLHAATKGVWNAQNMPEQCSVQNTPINQSPTFIISKADAGTIFTVYSRDVVQVNPTFTGDAVTGAGSSTQVYTPQFYSAQFSMGTALCGLDSSDHSEWICVATGPGVTTVYFPAPSRPTAMVEIAVIPGGPPSSTLSVCLVVLGLALIALCLLMGPIANRWRKVQDLRRADDDQR